MRDALDQTRALAEFVVREEVIAAPHTSLNVPIGGNRRMRMVAAPLADLKAIKSRLGGSVNDVVLAVAAGGLRRLLESRGEALPTRGVRVMVPVSIRHGSEQMSLGNRVSSLFVDLPVAEADALARYRQTMEAAESLKRSNLAAGAETLMDVAGVVRLSCTLRWRALRSVLACSTSRSPMSPAPGRPCTHSEHRCAA